MFSWIKETIGPFSGYLMPLIGLGFGDDDGGGGTPLPEALGADETLSGLGTVEKLAEAYKTSSSKTFVDFLPEEAKSDPAVTKYKTPEEFYKGHKSALELVGKKGIVVPGENATEEEKAKFRRDLGVPEGADGYQLTPIKNLHPDVKISPEAEAGFRAMMHKHGVPAKAADGIFQDFFGLMSQAAIKEAETKTAVVQESETKLRNEWGKDYETNLKLANRIVKKFGGNDAVSGFGDMGNNPVVLKTLAAIGKKMSEDSVTMGGIDLTVDESGAKARIRQMEADPAFLNESDPKHNALIEERTRLYEVAYGGGE